jgi:RNA polymerase sigma-70 factor (ECF subfamily)
MPSEHDRFLSLIEEHKKILFKVAGSYCSNPADRQDLLQEIVVQLWQSFRRYDDRFRFSTWMYRIALNVAISFYRRESRRTRKLVPAGDSILEVAAEASDTLESDENLRRLRELIASLDELDRALIVMYLDGNRYDAIAEVLGITESNVGTRIGRIKQRLRRDAARNA